MLCTVYMRCTLFEHEPNQRNKRKLWKQSALDLTENEKSMSVDLGHVWAVRMQRIVHPQHGIFVKYSEHDLRNVINFRVCYKGAEGFLVFKGCSKQGAEGFLVCYKVNGIKKIKSCTTLDEVNAFLHRIGQASSIIEDLEK